MATKGRVILAHLGNGASLFALVRVTHSLRPLRGRVTPHSEAAPAGAI